jgi:tripartite-type tricarboxylate transporter receptor subunit TctC
LPQLSRRGLLAAAALTGAATPATARAQASAQVAGAPYPDRAIRYIVPFAPAGITDMMARLVAQRLTEGFGRPVVVENRAGAAAMLGADVAAKAPPDGYTLLAITLTHAVNASLVRNPPYDLLRDFAAVSVLGAVPLVLCVNARSPIRSLAELVERLRAQPTAAGTPGHGSPPHLALELIRRASGAGTNITHAPYRGGAPVVNDLVAGTLDFAIPNLPEVLPQIRGGLLRGLAVTSEARHPLLAEVPTTAEAGMPTLRITNWTALLTQAAVPPAVLARLERETVAAMRDPVVARRAEEAGFDVLGWDAARSGQFIGEEVERWARLVAEAGIRAES